MKILFSPIGGTDPISNFRDGACLHICRHYRPEKVYLYLSKEMCAFHDNDNRYLYCIEQLGKKLQHSFECEVIRRDDLENVQIFDPFIEEFKSIIQNIMREQKVEQVLVNVSSGTPAMKSALLMLSVLYPDKIIPIQVATPEKRMNPHAEDKYHYEVEENWEVNEDNLEDTENRCALAVSHSWLLEVNKESVIRQIEAYDYVAAATLLEEMEGSIDRQSLQLVKAAACRLKMDFSGMTKEMQGIPVDFIPVKESDIRPLAEYALNLQIKLKKEEYADFIRALSPILWDLYAFIVKKECGIDVLQDLAYMVKTEEKGIVRYKWKLSAVQNQTNVYTALQREYGEFKGTDVGNDNLSTLIVQLCQNEKTKKIVENLKVVEKQVRNLAAHNIVSITDEKIRKITGSSANQIMESIRWLVDMYVLKGRKEIWQSYDQMNQVLIAHIKG